MRRTLFVAVVAVAVVAVSLTDVVSAQTTSAASPQDGLKFFKNYFLTGDYVVAGVNVRGTGVNGYATNTITITGVPSKSDVVAAYLYWETVETSATLGSGAIGATFGVDADGVPNPISGITELINVPGTSPCWSSGGGTGGGSQHILAVYRADVLGFLPANPNTSYPITLADAGVGNVVPSTAGASLVLVYRTTLETDPAFQKPLTSIVIYDGGYTMNQSTDSMSLTMRGFYEASSVNPSAKLTHIVADGSAAKSERLLFATGTTADDTAANFIEDNPFQGLASPSADPAWDNRTWDVSSHVSGDADTVTTRVTHVTSSFDCLSWGVVIFATTVQDTDNDGLLDIWETGVSDPLTGVPAPVVDPNGQPLPALFAMGANKFRKDLFLELGYTYAAPNTSYGGNGNPLVTDASGHTHLLSANAIRLLGDAFNAAPVGPPGQRGIALHVDAGNQYQGAPYVIPFTHADGSACSTDPLVNDTQCLARGGEAVLEQTCALNENCAFPDYPGTVGWKEGFQFYKDAAEGNQGEEIYPMVQDTAGTYRRRFDHNRKDMFHYAFFPHAVGFPKALYPCTKPDGDTVDLVNGACPEGSTLNPNFANDHKRPKSTSGIGDFIGGDVMITLGLWGNRLTPPQFGAPDFVTASTLAHELGHNLGRGHSGDVIGANESNCNPNYQSVMSYLSQIQGLSNNGERVIDFSRQVLPLIAESSLPQGLGTMTYWPTWFAPLSSVDQSLGTTVAQRHCDGTPLLPADVPMVQIEGTDIVTLPTAGGVAIDWNGDLQFNYSTGLDKGPQDVSFNGVINDAAHPLRGSDDWSFIAFPGLSQLATRRTAGGYSVDGKDFSGKDFSGKDFSGKDFSGKDFSGKDFSGKDFSGKDFSGKDFSGDQEFERAVAVGNPATSMKAWQEFNGKTNVAVRLTWKAPNLFGAIGIQDYVVYRVDGLRLTFDVFTKRVVVATRATPPPPDPTLDKLYDTKVTAGKSYTYFVVVRYMDGTQSGKSNLASLTVSK